MRNQRLVRLSIAAAGAAMILALPQGAVAHHDKCSGRVRQVGPLYIEQRGFPTEVWIYLESNGQPGLQSGGWTATDVYEDECDHPNPDTLIF